MKKSKLILSLKGLNSTEMVRFGEFIRSPFFNKHQETVIFFDILNEQRERWSFITKEEIYPQIYTGKYKKSRMNNLMFYLMELLKQFLGHLEFMKSKEQDRFILKGAVKRSMWKLFEGVSTKEKEQIKTLKIKDQQYYNRVFYLESRNDQYILARGKKHFPDHLKNEAEASEVIFILEKLKASCDMLSRMLVYNYDYDLGILNYLIKYIKQRWDYFGKILIINIYYRVLMTFIDPENYELYFTLVESFEKKRSEFNEEDLKNIYDYLINKGIELSNIDEEQSSRLVLRLYKALVNDKLHLTNNEIHHMTYKNIVVLACKVGEFDWAKSFMNSHRKNLNPEFRKNVYNFNLAHLYYNQKNYDEALLILGKLNFENVFYMINTKTTQIKVFYELQEYELLLSFLESYRLVLMRNKNIGPTRIKSTRNFIQYVRRFVKILLNKSILKRDMFEENLQKLKSDLLEKEAAVLNKNWILEKLETHLTGSI
jgi:hypothetical protein